MENDAVALFQQFNVYSPRPAPAVAQRISNLVADVDELIGRQACDMAKNVASATVGFRRTDEPEASVGIPSNYFACKTHNAFPF
jgi:hypothetical protein